MEPAGCKREQKLRSRPESLRPQPAQDQANIAYLFMEQTDYQRGLKEGYSKVNTDIAVRNRNLLTAIREITCHMGSHVPATRQR